MIFRLIERGRASIVTDPYDDSLILRKQEKLEILVRWLQSEGDKSLDQQPFWFLVDVAKDWCAWNCHKWEYWEKKLGRNRSTIFRNKQKSQKILREWREQELSKVHNYLCEIGRIEA